MTSSSNRVVQLHELLEQAPIRILRALRWCDWIDVYDFRDLVLDCTHEDKRSKDAIATGLARLIRLGFVERRGARVRTWGYTGGDRYCYDIRITEAGREWLAMRLRPDTRMEYAPARPGTEHLLCM